MSSGLGDIFVSDTNILIDLDIAGWVDSALILPRSLCVPDVLWIEELRDDHPDLVERGLQVVGLDPDVIDEVTRLAGIYRRPARNDLMALALAAHARSILVTGDRHLRAAAETEGIPVHGTLWLVAEMIANDCATVVDVHAGYVALFGDGTRRLPWVLVDQQMAELGMPTDFAVRHR